MNKQFNFDQITATFVENLESAGGTPLYELTPTEAQKFLVDTQRKYSLDIDAEIIDTFIPTDLTGEVDVRFVRPRGHRDEALPIIIYIHGGGWILGDKETHDGLIRTLSICTNAEIAFVNYSRSPEAKFPTALDEVYGVLEYLYKHHSDFNIDPKRIVIAGDSAGGNLAAAVTLKSKAEKGPKIFYQVLLYPVTDASMNTDSYREFKDGPWLSKKAMEWFWEAYVPEKNDRDNILVSPLKAEIDDLENLPSALVITAENDVLRDEGEQYAAKLSKAGVEVFSVRINQTHHDYLMLNALRNSFPAKVSFELICSVLNSKFKSV